MNLPNFSATMFLFFLMWSGKTLHINSSGLNVVLCINFGFRFFYEIVDKFGNLPWYFCSILLILANIPVWWQVHQSATVNCPLDGCLVKYIMLSLSQHLIMVLFQWALMFYPVFLWWQLLFSQPLQPAVRGLRSSEILL